LIIGFPPHQANFVGRLSPEWEKMIKWRNASPFDSAKARCTEVVWAVVIYGRGWGISYPEGFGMTGEFARFFATLRMTKVYGDLELDRQRIRYAVEIGRAQAVWSWMGRALSR
jgi:hypothetical protein